LSLILPQSVGFFKRNIDLKALKASLERHGTWCNRRIVVLYAVANFYLDQAISDLENSKLVAGEDYLCFEPASCPVIGRETLEVEPQW